MNTGIPELDEYNALTQQIRTLQARADDLRALAIQRAAEIARAIMEQAGLTVADFVQEKRPRAQVDHKPPKPKYRDPASGKTWSGYGPAPAWIKGQDRARFRIAR